MAAEQGAIGLRSRRVIESQAGLNSLQSLAMMPQIEIDCPNAMVDLQLDFGIVQANKHLLHPQGAIMHDAEIGSGVPPAPEYREVLRKFGGRTASSNVDTTVVELLSAPIARTELARQQGAEGSYYFQMKAF